jgi:hypothetical protein
MTREDIIRLAREAGFDVEVQDTFNYKPQHSFIGSDENIERFATLVAAAERKRMKSEGWRQCAERQRTTQFCGLLEGTVAAEREACAKLADEFYREGMDYDIGAAIRARKQEVPK